MKDSGLPTRARMVLATCSVLAVVLAIGWCRHNRPVAEGSVPLPYASRARGDAPASPSEQPTGNDAAGRPQVVMATRRGLHAAFRRAQRCYFARQDVLSDRSRIAACKAVTAKDLPENVAACRADLARLPRHLALAEIVLQECEMGVPDLDMAYYRHTRAAAAIGDPDAQMCYLVGNFGDVDLQTRDLAEFRSRAPLYIDAALSRGDWRVAALLAESAAYHSFDPIDHVGLRKPLVAYRMNRLLRHGATGDYAATLDAVAHNGWTAGGRRSLSPVEVANADAWARRTYLRGYRASPPMARAPIPCTLER